MILVGEETYELELQMSRRDQDVNPALRTLKKSFTAKYGFCSLYESLHHILSYIDPNEVIQISVPIRHMGEQLL